MAIEMKRLSLPGAFGSLAVAAVLMVPAAALGQRAKVSDAQVESNVLKAFAGDGRLANQSISTSTVYGTVTLTGSVTTEDARNAAEQIASRTDGVTKVVDQLTVGAAPSVADAQMPPQQAEPKPQQMPMQPNQQQDQVYNGQPQPGYGQPQPGYGAPQGSGAQGYPNAQGDPNGYPPPPNQQRRLYRRDYERQQGQGGGAQGYAQPQGQPGGQQVTVPGGAVLAVRINRWITSGDAQAGSTFSALVANDVLAGGQIAIPRGATVEGTVVAAKGAGSLKGRGTLTLQLTTLEMGGQRVPLQSETFTVNGHDKAAQSVNSTLIGAGVGALLGAAIGRGTGAAIGAGLGGAAGLGSSAASGGGQAAIPAEALLHFRLTQALAVTTVSEMEMQRLGSYAGPARPYGEPYARPNPYAYPVGVYASPYPYYVGPRYYRRGYYY